MKTPELGSIYEDHATLQSLTEAPELGTLMVRVRYNGGIELGEIWQYAEKLDRPEKKMSNEDLWPHLWAAYPITEETKTFKKEDLEVGKTYLASLNCRKEIIRLKEIGYCACRVDGTGYLNIDYTAGPKNTWSDDWTYTIASKEQSQLLDNHIGVSPLPFSGKFSDFKGSGDFYVSGSPTFNYVIRITETGIPEVNLDSKKYLKEGKWLGVTSLKIDKATPEQSAHLQACIDADKYVAPVFNGFAKDFPETNGYFVLKSDYEYNLKLTEGKVEYITDYLDSCKSLAYGWGWVVEIRPSTEQEIKHLDLCIKAGKYVEPASLESKINIKDFKGEDGIYKIIEDDNWRALISVVNGEQEYILREDNHADYFQKEHQKVTEIRPSFTIEPASAEEIEHFNLCKTAGKYVEPQSLSEQVQEPIDAVVELAKVELDPKNLIVGEIYTCCTNFGTQWIYQFTKPEDRIPFCTINSYRAESANNSDFQSNTYHSHAIATEEQKQMLYKHLPELKPSQEAEYWQDLYGQCYSAEIKTEENREGWRSRAIEQEEQARDWEGKCRSITLDATGLEQQLQDANNKLAEKDGQIAELEESVEQHAENSLGYAQQKNFEIQQLEQKYAELEKQEVTSMHLVEHQNQTIRELGREVKREQQQYDQLFKDFQEVSQIDDDNRRKIQELTDVVEVLRGDLTWKKLELSGKKLTIEQKDQQIAELSQGFFKKLFKGVKWC